MVNINYMEMANYYQDIISDIKDVQSKISNWKWKDEPEPSEELLKKADKDYIDCYASFDRAYYRLGDVENLIDFENESDFKCYALNNIRDAKYRIEHFLEDARLEYPKYDLNKYDSILEDYYNNIDFNENAYDKYLNITYLRTNINLGICYDIDHCYELFDDDLTYDKQKNYKILNQIVELVKQLDGFQFKDQKHDRWKDA